MKNPQPNFEKIKQLFMYVVRNSKTVDFAILKEQIHSNKNLKCHHARKQDFFQEANKWVDTVDIRMVGSLIDFIKKEANDMRINIPAWVKNKKYEIDYNDNGALDLIIIH